jgi:predicted O-methyltransferase YrrM
MSKQDTLQAITDLRVRETLSRLHQLADKDDRNAMLQFAPQVANLALKRKLPWEEIEPRLDERFLALDRTQGIFIHMLARAIGARRIVEFGTSFGISTIYLALAVRENGGGVVIGTERVPEKAQRARAHLQEAGLDAYVDIRVGDAMETLREVEGPIDLMLNDGFPRFALPVLKLVQPALRPGAAVMADNVGAFPADHEEYVRYVRDPSNGFVSAMLKMNEGTELSVKL